MRYIMYLAYTNIDTLVLLYISRMSDNAAGRPYDEHVKAENQGFIQHHKDRMDYDIFRARINYEKLVKDLEKVETPGLFTRRETREREAARLRPLVTAAQKRLENMTTFREGLDEGFSGYIDWHESNVGKFATIMYNENNLSKGYGTGKEYGSKEYLGQLMSIYNRGGGSGMMGGSLLGYKDYTFSNNGVIKEIRISWDDDYDRIFLKFSDAPPSWSAPPPTLNQGGGRRRRTRKGKHKRRAATKRRHRRT
jgi:hypothetical protein